MTTNRYDMIVAGAGAMGMAAGCYAAEKGASVLLLDAFNPPHDQGSHHGDTRIIRHAYAMHETYVPMALRAQSLWEELERETGTVLNRKIGLLRVCRQGAPSLKRQEQYAGKYGIPLERLSAGQMTARWPGLRMDGDEEGCYEPQGGLLYSEACIDAYRKLAGIRGAELHTNEPVLAIEPDEENVRVTTAQCRYEAKRLIVCAGAWSAKLLSELGLPVRTIRKPIAWFEADSRRYDAGSFPAFTYNLPMGEYYGIPGDGASGLKVGRHDSGRTADPDTMDRRFGTFPEDEADLREFLGRYMPGANGARLRGSVCMYAMTEDENFIIDRHPRYRSIWTACGFSGHGFKFSSAVGELLAEWALGREPELDMSPFSLSRFAGRA